MERGKAYRYRRNSGRGTNLPPDFIRRRLNYIIRQLPDWEGQEIGERRPVSFLSSQVRRFPKIRSQNYFPEFALRTWSFGKGRMATIGLRREVQLTIPPCPPLPQTASLADPIPVPFGYTLCTLLEAGTFCVKKSLMKNEAISSFGPAQALAIEPYGTHPNRTCEAACRTTEPCFARRLPRTSCHPKWKT